MANSTQIATLHQTKTLVGLFKANYQTRPDLAIDVYHTMAPQLPQASNFLYRDQVVKLGLARLDADLVFGSVPSDSDDPEGNRLAYLYDLYQTALVNPTFSQVLVDFFAETRPNNYVFQALTATPDSSVGQFLAGNVPDNFLADPYLLGMSLALHLDGIWLAVTPAAVTPAALSPEVSPEVLAQLNPAELVALTRRAVANPDLIQALTTLGLFQYQVYAAFVLLTQGVEAYAAYVNPIRGQVSLPQSLESVVAWLGDKVELKPQQWREIINIVRQEAKMSTLELFDEVNLTTKVVMASHITNEGVKLKLSLAGALAEVSATVAPNTDLTTVMAKFQLTEADLMAVTAGDAADRYHISRLLPFYSGSAAVLDQFITKSVMVAHVLLEYDQHGHFTGLGPAVVPAWLYLAAISAGLTVPQHNHQVETLTSDDVALLGYYFRRNYPKKVPAELVEFAEDMKLLLLEHQSIVEDIYLVTETHQDDHANEF